MYGKAVKTLMRYDSAIIGTGPAGLEAAINLKIRGKNFLLFGSDVSSKKISLAPKINNYLGMPGIGGGELAQRFSAHVAEMGIEVTRAQVSTIYPMGGYFSLATNRDVFEASTVILATGAFSASLYPGEQEFLGRGVGYCATCDAPLYRGKTVAIVGFGDESALEANFVAEIAEKIYYIPVKKSDVKLDESIIVVDNKVVGISGGLKAERLLLDGRELAVDGVFILRENIAPASLVPGLALDGGFIAVDAKMRTNIPGCFAAGDCTGKPHQYMRAAGQGQVAALEAAAHLDMLKQQK